MSAASLATQRREGRGVSSHSLGVAILATRGPRTLSSCSISSPSPVPPAPTEKINPPIRGQWDREMGIPGKWGREPGWSRVERPGEGGRQRTNSWRNSFLLCQVAPFFPKTLKWDWIGGQFHSFTKRCRRKWTAFSRYWLSLKSVVDFWPFFLVFALISPRYSHEGRVVGQGLQIGLHCFGREFSLVDEFVPEAEIHFFCFQCLG